MSNAESFDLKTKYLALAKIEDRPRFAAQIIKETSELGVYPASIQPLYQALGRKEIDPITVPAFNLRGLTYQLARVIWRKALELHCGPLIFELAPSECGAGDQDFDEFAAMVLAAACREGYQGPVFLQGDHFCIGSDEEETARLNMAKEVIKSGFYQIDIDGSHLIAPDSDNLEEVHRQNAEVTARLVIALRAQQPDGVELVLGGEVGEIGGHNTSPADLEVFHQLLSAKLPSGIAGLDKISAQTGTTHSGVVLKDGSIGHMEVDFELVRALSDTARDLGWNGLVQHGASTLSIADLAKLPSAGVIEVHLATHIQNIVFDHPAFPQNLRQSMQDRLVVTSRGAEGELIDNADTLTSAQQFYKARWAAWGVFKPELWDMTPEVMAPIEASFGDWITEVCTALQVINRAALLQHFF